MNCPFSHSTQPDFFVGDRIYPNETLSIKTALYNYTSQIVPTARILLLSFGTYIQLGWAGRWSVRGPLRVMMSDRNSIISPDTSTTSATRVLKALNRH